RSRRDVPRQGWHMVLARGLYFPNVCDERKSDGTTDKSSLVQNNQDDTPNYSAVTPDHHPRLCTLVFLVTHPCRPADVPPGRRLPSGRPPDARPRPRGSRGPPC